MIGIFDSGLGGKFFLEKAQKAFPNEKFVLFQDSEFMPYGNKSKEKVLERSLFAIDFLKDQGAQKVICACNTASLVLDFFGFNDSCVFSLFESLKNICVLNEKKGISLNILCTKLTGEFLINSSAFAFHKIIPLSDLAGIIEEKKLTFDYLKDNLSGLSGVVLLGCTHFSAIKKELADLNLDFIDVCDVFISNMK